jgi:hypothetical protein
MHYEDLDQSLAGRRGHWEHCQLPKRYRDIVPEPPASLPLAPSQVMSPFGQMETAVSQVTVPSPSPEIPMHPSAFRKTLKSTCNIFGLFRQYYATHFPNHDPDENQRPDILANVSPDISSTH